MWVLARPGRCQPPPAQTQTTVEIVADDRHHGRQHEEVEHPVGERLEQGQTEDVEPDVEGEDRIDSPEILGVDEEKDVVPPGGDGQAEEDGETPGQPETDLSDPRLDPLPESLDHLLFFGQVEGSPARRHSVDQPEAHPKDQEGHCDTEGAKKDRKAPSALPHLIEANRVEPQIVGPECSQCGQGEIQRRHGDQDQSDRPPSVRPVVGWNPREHWR